MPTIPDTIDAPLTHVSSISKWSSTTYQAFCQAQYTQSLVDEEFVTASDLFYSLRISRGEGLFILKILHRIFSQLICSNPPDLRDY